MMLRTLMAEEIGLFGAGHLGRAIAQGLIDAGFPRQRLTMCHRGSAATGQALAAAGLADRVVDRGELLRRSRIILYLVRPQDRRAIEGCRFREDALLVSFLAGIPLDRLPVRMPGIRKVRVMTSAPDTLRLKNGLAAMVPADCAEVSGILAALRLRVIALRRESDLHAFTAFGASLPIALTCWEGLGHDVDEPELIQAALGVGLDGWDEVVAWARAVQPRGLAARELNDYLAQSTTPGGVTEAILKAMARGRPLSAALERGIQRSRELETT